MFTGIVEELGSVKSIISQSGSIRLIIECNVILNDMKVGDSIAVNGICLTVTRFGDNWFAAHVMPETMRRTSLSVLRPSDRVNLERSLKLSDRLGGHMVSGHIDGTGIITDKTREDNAVWLTVEADQSILKFIVMKGSVALDGTSLTVAYADHRCFKVSLIPLTAGVTTLGQKETGDMVNVECDVIGKYVDKLMGGKTSRTEVDGGLTMELLEENGFV